MRPYPTEWFYDEYTNDGIDEPKSPNDDEYDYDPRYGNKKRRKRRPATQKLQKSVHTTEHTPRKRASGGASGSRRGRRKTATGKSSSAL